MPVSNECLDVIFRNARTHVGWLPKPVSDDVLRSAYDLAKFGPTSANTMPLRIVFVRSPEGKQRLRPALAEGNIEKTMTAPVTAIFADDLQFFEHIPKLFPVAPQFKDVFASPANAEKAKVHAFRNATLQAAYFIIACRAVGLDVGPMSGFDNAKLDAEFFPDGRHKSNFIMNIGYGDRAKLRPRFERLTFEEACKIV